MTRLPPVLGPDILLNALFSEISVYVPPSKWETKFRTHTYNWQNYSFVYFNLCFFLYEMGRQKIL